MLFLMAITPSMSRNCMQINWMTDAETQARTICCTVGVDEGGAGHVQGGAPRHYRHSWTPPQVLIEGTVADGE